MKIAMIGSGAAGSVFASYLRKGGAEEVWLVDPNKAHMDKVARDGMIFRNPDGEFHVTGFKTAYSAEEVGVADIVILMVKATITELALKGAMSCVGPETVVATLQNGLGNEEVVKKLVPEDRVMYGCGNMGPASASPSPPRVLKICISAPASKMSSPIVRASILRRSSLPAAFCPTSTRMCAPRSGAKPPLTAASTPSAPCCV